MDFKSLLNKIVENGKLILAQPTMMFVDKEDIGTTKHEVTVYQEGRPDLIALENYGSAEHVDYLLKFNNISDPFSVKEGDVLLIPVLGPNYKKLERPVTEDLNIVRQEFLDKKRLTPKDQKRIDFLKKKYGVKEVLPPNVLKSGFKNYKFNKGDEPGTELGMTVSTPENAYSKPKKTAKSLGSVFDDAWKQVPKAVFDKEKNDLTVSEVNTLSNAGISLEDFDNVKNTVKSENTSEKIEGVSSDSSSSTKKVFDEDGNYIGTESEIKSFVVEDGKKQTTVTKTIVKPDGTTETTQTTTFSTSDDSSNNINIEKKSINTESSNSTKTSKVSNKESNKEKFSKEKTDESLERKIKSKRKKDNDKR